MQQQKVSLTYLLYLLVVSYLFTEDISCGITLKETFNSCQLVHTYWTRISSTLLCRLQPGGGRKS